MHRSSARSDVAHHDSRDLAERLELIDSRYRASWVDLSPEIQRALEPAWSDCIESLGRLSQPSEGRPLDELLWVALVGGTNVGKSTLFNLITGGDHSPVRATASATKRALVWGLPLMTETEQLSSPIGMLSPLVDRELVIADPKREISLEISDTALFVTSPIEGEVAPSDALHDSLQGLALIDCPDHDSDLSDNGVIARQVARRADLCIYVTTPQKYRSQATIEMIATLSRHHHEVWVIFNLMSEAQEEEVEELWRDLEGEVYCENERGEPRGAEYRASAYLKLLGSLTRARSPQELQKLRGDLIAMLSALLAGTPQQYKSRRRLEHFNDRRLILSDQARALYHRKRDASHRFAHALNHILAGGEVLSETSTSRDDLYEDLPQALRAAWSRDQSDSSLDFESRATRSLARGSVRHLSRWLSQSNAWPVHLHQRYQRELVRLVKSVITLDTAGERSDPDRPTEELLSIELEWSYGRFADAWNQVRVTLNRSDDISMDSDEMWTPRVTSQLKEVYMHRLRAHLTRLGDDSLDPQDGLVESPTLSQRLFGLCVAILIGFMLSWVLSSLISIALGQVMGELLGYSVGLLALSLLALDLPHLINAGVTTLDQGSAVIKLQGESTSRARCEAHRELWSSLTSAQGEWDAFIRDAHLNERQVSLHALISALEDAPPSPPDHTPRQSDLHV